eukprot:SAG11_NODE_23777_length_383_cov_0.855634_1_plen_76_part_00
MVSGEGLDQVRLSLRFAVVWPLSRPLSCVVVLRALQVFRIDDEKNEAKPAILIAAYSSNLEICRRRVYDNFPMKS